VKLRVPVLERAVALLARRMAPTVDDEPVEQCPYCGSTEV